MRTLKSKGGFTLVELIVVIAILAILAGVAIPVYNGYIKKAQDATVVTELDAIQTAAQAANAQAGSISKVVVTTTGITVTAKDNKFAENYDKDFVLFYDKAEDASDATEGVFNFVDEQEPELAGTSYENGATWVPAAVDNLKAGWNAN